MQLAAAHDLGVSFVTRRLFSGLDFTLQHNARVGLVGMNGCGKTTLLRVMSGQLTPDTGCVVFNREARLAYMEQFLLADEDMTLYEAVLQVFSELTAIERQLAQLNRRLEREHTPALLGEQQKLQDRYADQGGYTYALRLRAALLGLGFSEEDFQLPVRALSGGQRSKAALAKVLLSDANLLLLDEPTNHLDIASIEWLEAYLAAYRGAFILISHDRYFLDQATNETWAMEHGGLRCFPGNYSAHLTLKESEDEAARRVYQNRMREIRRVEGIIEQQKRFNQARNYVTIASKQKQIERLKFDLKQPRADAKT
ncbi:MAG: ABC-F family ATP-binding cassette domain-containing protein, partial [Clostridia bacterium]|nr:ABC-F family ATP-binding cassette domain-containing protein [Clostridia bacterium]